MPRTAFCETNWEVETIKHVAEFSAFNVDEIYCFNFSASVDFGFD